MTPLTEDESDKLYMADPLAKSLGAFIEALQIFAKYADVNKRFEIDAQHDVIYAHSQPDEDSEDGKRLIRFGWHWEGDSESWAHIAIIGRLGRMNLC